MTAWRARSLLLAAAAGALAAPPTLDDLAGAPQDVRSCFASNANRTSCNTPGTSEQACGDRGCCWDASKAGIPWCYVPQARPEPSTPSGSAAAQRYAGSQSAPAVASLLGAAHASVTGDVVAGVACLSLPPLAQECDYTYGGPRAAYGWPAALTVNGEAPVADATFQSFPYQVVRAACTASGDAVTTALRLSGSTNLALLTVNVTFSAAATAAAVSAVVPMHIATFPGAWAWDRPTASSDPSRYVVGFDGAGVGAVAVSRDAASGAVAATGAWLPDGCVISWALRNVSGAGLRPGLAAAFTITWAARPPPGGTVSVSFGLALALGATDAAAVAVAARAAAATFPAAWSAARSDWDAVWRGAFDGGGGGVFSGALPALPWPLAPSTAAPQPASLARAYYGGVASALMLLRRVAPGGSAANTGWQLPTAAPVWAVTTTYLWDSSMVATLMALLEPAGWLAAVADMLRVDTHAHYAVDYLSGGGVGPWYAFNDLSAFTLLDRYGQAAAVGAAVRARLAGEPAPTAGGGNYAAKSASAPRESPAPFLGDLAFYNSTLNGVRVVEWLDRCATFYTSRPSCSGLADYGDATNLLECVPTYVHAVPALNAANVFMLNRTAAVWRALGNASRADALLAAAAALLPRVLGMYVPGEGVWACVYPNGTRVPVRHAVDLITVADSIAWALPASTRAEMRDFFVAELRSNSSGGGGVWMRALSLRDAAANVSDRADHGPLGAYDGWPPRAAAALAELGFPSDGAAFLAAAAGVLDEGPFGQAHRLLRDGAPAKAGGPGGQDALEAVGGAFADAALWLLAHGAAEEGKPTAHDA